VGKKGEVMDNEKQDPNPQEEPQEPSDNSQEYPEGIPPKPEVDGPLGIQKTDPQRRPPHMQGPQSIPTMEEDEDDEDDGGGMEVQGLRELGDFLERAERGEEVEVSQSFLRRIYRDFRGQHDFCRDLMAQLERDRKTLGRGALPGVPRLFRMNELPLAYEWVARGYQAVHIFYWPSELCRDKVFKKLAKRGEPFGHLLDRNADRLIDSAYKLGIREPRLQSAGTRKQHIDLCGAPLLAAVSCCNEVVERITAQMQRDFESQ